MMMCLCTKHLKHVTYFSSFCHLQFIWLTWTLFMDAWWPRVRVTLPYMCTSAARTCKRKYVYVQMYFAFTISAKMYDRRLLCEMWVTQKERCVSGKMRESLERHDDAYPGVSMWEKNVHTRTSTHTHTNFTVALVLDDLHVHNMGDVRVSSSAPHAYEYIIRKIQWETQIDSSQLWTSLQRIKSILLHSENSLSLSFLLFALLLLLFHFMLYHERS